MYVCSVVLYVRSTSKLHRPVKFVRAGLQEGKVQRTERSRAQCGREAGEEGEESRSFTYIHGSDEKSKPKQNRTEQDDR